MADAFTAGVKPGGLTDDLQIKILLCYLIKTAAPVQHDTLQGALLQEQLVNYFEFADALDELERQGLIEKDRDGCYNATKKGGVVANDLGSDLPRSVRESAIRAVMQIQSWRQKAAVNRAKIEPSDNGYILRCSLGEGSSSAFAMQLDLPDQYVAEITKNNFTAHGDEIYRTLMDMLTQYSTEEARPPEGML